MGMGNRGAIAKSIGVVLTFMAATLRLGAAEVSVPLMELSTTGEVKEGTFELSSHAEVELAIEGGFKFGGQLRFAFESDDLEKALGYAYDETEYSEDGVVSDEEYNALLDRLTNQTALSFRLAKVTVREPGGIPLNFSYFIGLSDVFCSGDDFPLRFGTSAIGTSFKGYAYFPDGIGGNSSYQYNGIHAANGTGIAVEAPIWDNVVPILYVYQDIGASGSANNQGSYSGDLRLMTNAENIKFEVFVGASTPYGDFGRYRGGALAFFSTGTGASFLAQVGAPGWDSGSAFSSGDLYFLFEPRIAFGNASINITLFSHPARYLQQDNPEESGATDMNIKFMVGDLRVSTMEGGMETTVGVHPNALDNDDTFVVTVAPFFGIFTEGLRWDFKLRVHPLLYADPLEMFQTFISVRTAY